MAHVFVYGTLKAGFPNYAVNTGRRIVGTYRTQQAYPLYVVKLPNADRPPHSTGPTLSAYAYLT